MTLDEDAATVAKIYSAMIVGLSESDIKVDLLAFGRRCAEAMREKCAKCVCSECSASRQLVTDWDGNKGFWHQSETEGHYPCKAQAIRRVEVK